MKKFYLLLWAISFIKSASGQITINYDASGNMISKQITADMPVLRIEGETFAVNRQSNYQVTPAVATSTYQWAVTGGYVWSGQGTANVTVQWTTDSIGTLRVVERNVRQCEGLPTNFAVQRTAKHQIQLATGWNFISTFLQPLNDSISAVTADIASQVLSVRNKDFSYRPNEPANTLWRMSGGQAYFMRMSSPATLTVIGKALDVNGLRYTLPANQWYYLGYPLDTTLPIRTALNSILTEIVGVKTLQGSFAPNNDDAFNTLREMRAGNGFFIKVRNAVTFTFPNHPLHGLREPTNNTLVQNPLLPADWQLMAYPSSMVAFGRVTLDDLPVAETDKIGVFVGNECRAQGDIRMLQQESVTSMVVNGTESAPITFKLLKNGRIYTSSYRPMLVNGAWISDSLLPLRFYSEVAVDKMAQGTFKVYPNPMRDWLTVEWELPFQTSSLSLQIVNAAGQLCYNLPNLPVSIGKQQLNLSRSDYPLSSGAYFLHWRGDNSFKAIPFFVN